MIICEHCFNDEEIASIIRSVAVVPPGACPCCKSESSYLYDTSLQSELTPYFEELLDIYAPVSVLPDSYPKESCQLIIDELNIRWRIFSTSVHDKVHDIITSICPDYYTDNKALFEEIVGIPELYDDGYLKKHALLKNQNWDAFVNEIKTQNRYHSKLINFEILEKYCSFIRKTYREGTLFYRARISDRAGFTCDEMYAPPPGKSAEGRANAKGITCLYVANDTETTLHEVRAGMFDYVSVGTLRLKRDITIVNLRAISQISPFLDGLEYLDHAINQQYLERLNTEMSKSLRRSDSALDYVPTQYIVDFIKSIEHNGDAEYDGIEYNSTTNPGGYNLAIFNPDLFECISVDVYDIESLEYTSRKL